MIGLTSVTFRQFNVEEIIEISKKAKINMIEWGSDVHVPEGDYVLAKKVGDLTRENGIETLSYGSYYKLGVYDTTDVFETYIKTAKYLGCSIIRIWTSDVENKNYTEELLQQNINELKKIATIAEKYNIMIGLEYHRHSLTETMLSTKLILESVNHKNVKTYWQMNPDLSHKERLAEIKALKEHVISCHVFYWEKDKNNNDIRAELSEGIKQWIDYIEELKQINCFYIIEFVKDDSIEQFYRDVQSLKNFLVYYSKDGGIIHEYT